MSLNIDSNRDPGRYRLQQGVQEKEAVEENHSKNSTLPLGPGIDNQLSKFKKEVDPDKVLKSEMAEEQTRLAGEEIREHPYESRQTQSSHFQHPEALPSLIYPSR